MTIRYTNEFLVQLKKQNVRIRKSFKKAINVFSKDPNNTELNNHELKREWVGYRSIDITAEWRAIYKMVKLTDETIVYFTTLGIHIQLYKSFS